MKTTRIQWVDIAKFICIMCVMGSHLESMTAPLSRVFTPFYLSLFFFCSGYVYKDNAPFGQFFLKKVKQLLIPWLILSVANILLSHVLSFNEHGSLTEELCWNFLQIRGEGDGLWFIAALFVAFVPFYFVIRWFHKGESSPERIGILLGVSVLLSLLSRLYGAYMDPSLFPWNSYCLPWHLEYIFVAMLFMVLGYLFKTSWEEKFDGCNGVWMRVGLWLAYLALVCLGVFLPIRNELADIFFTYLQQLLGMLAVISVCKVIKPNRFILFIGQNTLLCFALHGKVYSLMQTVCKKIAGGIYSAILGNVVSSSLLAIVFTFVMSLILIVPIYLIDRYLPFVAGKKRKQ